MARTKQKLINYHGSDYTKVVATAMTLGEIAVATKKGEEHIGVYNGTDVAWFMTSAQTVEAIQASANHSVVSAATDAEFLKVSVETLDNGGKKYVLTDAGIKAAIGAASAATFDAAVTSAQSYTNTVSGDIESTIVALSGDAHSAIAAAEKAAKEASSAYTDYVVGNLEADDIAIVAADKDKLSGATVEESLVALADAVAEAQASGVLSFGEKTGDITLKDESANDVAVVLSMNENELGAALKGVASSADTEAAIAAAEKAAKEASSAYTDYAINLITSGAPEAFDTLKEIADYIKADSGRTINLIAEMNAISGNVKDALHNVTLSAAADDAKYITVTAETAGDDYAKVVNLGVDLAVEASGTTADDKLAAKSYVDGKVAELAGDALTAVTLNGIDFEVADNAASATIYASAITLGEAVEYSGKTLAAADATVPAAMSALTSQMVANEKVTAAALNELDERVGDLADLETTEKSNVVAAINELVGDSVTGVEFAEIAGTATTDVPASGAKAQVADNKIQLDLTELVIDCGSWD